MALVEWSGILNRERDELVARLNRARTIDEEGKVHFEEEPFFEDVVGVLEAALTFPEEVAEIEPGVRWAQPSSPGRRRSSTLRPSSKW